MKYLSGEPCDIFLSGRLEARTDVHTWIIIGGTLSRTTFRYAFLIEALNSNSCEVHDAHT